MDYTNLTDEQLQEEAKTIEVKFKLQKEKLEKVYYSRNSIIIQAFGNVLGGLNSERHPYLSSVINRIQFCKGISGNVDTYRTKIPFCGLKLISEEKEYTIIYQGDSDYDYCFDSFCEGSEPYIGRSNSNLFNVEQEMLHEAYKMNIDELEDFFVSKKYYLENQQENPHLFHVEIYTILHSLCCM